MELDFHCTHREFAINALADKLMHYFCIQTDLWGWSSYMLGRDDTSAIIYHVFSSGELVWMNCCAYIEPDIQPQNCVASFIRRKTDSGFTKYSVFYELAKQIIDGL